MFTIEETYGELVIPEEYESKIKGWLENNEELYEQIKKQVRSEKKKIFPLYQKNSLI